MSVRDDFIGRGAKQQIEDSSGDTIDRYRRAFEESHDAMAILTREAQVVDMNQTCLDLLGYQRQEMLGMEAQVLFAGPDGQPRLLREMGRSGASKDYEVQFRRKDGKPIDSLVTSIDWRDKDENPLGYICVVRDVTAQKRTERSLTLLLGMSDKLNSTVDLETLLDSLVEQVLDLTNAESGCAGLRTPQGMSCDHFFQGHSIVPLVYHCVTGVGWPGWVLAHRTHYLTNDVLNDPLVVQEVRDRLGIRSGISVPIADNERDVIAFFEVYNKRDGAGFDEFDVQYSLAAARIASLAIHDCLARRNLIALTAFSQSLTVASDFDQMLENVGRHIEMNFNRHSVILLPNHHGLMVRFRSAEFMFDDKELSAASWSWEHGQEAGASTEALSGARAQYIPLKTRGQVIGVLGLEVKQGTWFSNVQRQFFNAFINQLTLAIERGLLEQKVRRLRFFEESERVQTAVLSAISHDLRAPLAAIATSLSGLLTSDGRLDQTAERELLETADIEVRRLNRLVNNLLSMTRIEAGLSSVKLEPHELLDLVWAAIEDLGPSARQRQISFDIPGDLPLVPLDFGLITQVLVNLLSNAFKYSPPDRPITVRGRVIDHQLEVLVVDRGIGVPGEDLGRVFDKFYRVAESGSAYGLGLGLAICKEFIEAHGGRIHLEKNPMGGTIARFVLPLDATATH